MASSSSATTLSKPYLNSSVKILNEVGFHIDLKPVCGGELTYSRLLLLYSLAQPAVALPTMIPSPVIQTVRRVTSRLKEEAF